MTMSDDSQVQTYGFILIDGFALMSYASASEPLRAANLLAGRDLYRLAAFSPDGSMARASSKWGVTMNGVPFAGRTSASRRSLIPHRSPVKYRSDVPPGRTIASILFRV